MEGKVRIEKGMRRGKSNTKYYEKVMWKLTILQDY